MPDSAAFEFACDQLEARTSLDRLAARGTVRIALKQAGLDARGITPAQMAVVVQKILPIELGSRGIDAVDEICQTILASMETRARKAFDRPADSPAGRLAD